MARRLLLPIALLAAVLHGIGIARSSLPAQDGLKFLRVARGFHSENWVDVVRGSDQHPLYPLAIAATQPLVSLGSGPSPDSWRIAAQVVSAMASLALLLPLFELSRSLLSDAAAALTALLWTLLPLPAQIGHDTLSDPLALLAFASAICLGERALRTRSLRAAVGCGVASGIGYLARPEVALVPLAVALTAGLGALLARRRISGDAREVGHATRSLASFRSGLPLRTGVLWVAFLTFLGAYALVKGEVSEKLSIRRAVAVSSVHDRPYRVERRLPAGLDTARWDFSAKEESDHPGHLGLPQAAGRLAGRWAEAMGFLLVPMVGLGVWSGQAGEGKRLTVVYAGLFVLILTRHAMTFGYLSARHTLSLVLVALPFAAAGLLVCVRAVRSWRERRSPGSVGRTSYLRVAALGLMMAPGLCAQMHHSPHPSRWGHGAAGRWLAAHAGPMEKVLDTRGWAAFVSTRPGLDYWHVKQALMDPDLAYVVVGEDERTARSRRAETLRALLAYAAEPIAAFPEREGGEAVGVRVYRFRRPDDWKGMRP